MVRLDGAGLPPRLEPLSLTIPKGVTAILGPSGSGKSTLLHILVGFEKPTVGAVAWDARESPTCGWAPQDYGLWQGVSVIEHLAVVSPDGSDDAALLAQFGLADRRTSCPHQLSVGQCARLSVARALAMQPEVLVLDEPFASVDAASAEPCKEALLAWCEQTGGNLLIATHQPDLVFDLADHVLCLDGGRLLAAGAPQDLYARPRHLVAAKLLGPCNQLPDGQLVRPEHTAVVADREGPWTLAGCSQRGAWTRCLLKGPESLHILVADSPSASAGSQVRIQTRC